MENANPNIARVQHVAKASSDQLLRKFADDSDGKKDLRLAKRVKRNQQHCGASNSNGNANAKNSSLPERKSLLPAAAAPRKQAALMRRLGLSRAKIKAREIKNKSIITAIEKTWRTTVEGASRVLMEKHYNRHKRLINDSYQY